MYKGCTKDAQRMSTIQKTVQPSRIRCASLVHSANGRKRSGGGGRLRLWRFGCHRRLNIRFLVALLFAWQRPGRDDGAGDVILGFPAVLHLASDDEDLLTGAGLAKPGGVLSGDVALAVGRRPEQAQVADPALLHPASAAWGLPKEH